jgi:N-acetylneuraminate synthase
MLEVHVTLSREMFGPDVPASLTTGEFRQLVEGVRFIEKMHANPVDKDAIAEEMQPLREAFFKSVVARGDLPAGVILERGHLTIKKPGTGVPADQIETLIGRKLRRALMKNELIQEEDLE